MWKWERPRKHSTHGHGHCTFTVSPFSTPEEFDFTHHPLDAPSPLLPHSDDPYSINQPAVFIRCRHQPLWNSGLSPHKHHEWVWPLSISVSLSFSLSAVTWVSPCCILSPRSCWEITGLLGTKAAKCYLDFIRHVPLFFSYMDVECLSKFRDWEGLWSPAHWPYCRSNNPWVL